MKTQIDKSKQDFIEIPLYEMDNNHPSLRTVMIKTIIAILIVVVILYFILAITEILLLIATVTMVLILSLVYNYYNCLFPTSNETLVIVYEEIHLMDKEKIKWYQSIKECQFEQQKNTKIPIIKIFDKQHFTMTIQYTVPIEFNAKTCRQSDNYIIHSKSDWNRLKRSLNIK